MDKNSVNVKDQRSIANREHPVTPSTAAPSIPMPSHPTPTASAPALPAIMHIIWSLTPGGAERQLVTMAIAAHDAGHPVFVATLEKPGALADELLAKGIPVFPLFKNRALDVRLIRTLARLIDEHHIGIIHAHLFGSNLWGRIAARLSRQRPLVVTHEHSTLTTDRWDCRVLEWLFSPWHALSIAVSADIARRLRQCVRLPEEKILLLRNGIILDRWHAIRNERAARLAQRQTAGLPPRIVIVGTLEPRKDHATFIHAAGLMLENGFSAEFCIVGDGPLRTALEKLAEETGHPEAFSFLGNRKDIPDILAESALYVSSSVTEGISLALLEAMAAGVPVCATAVGGVMEVAGGERSMLLIPPQNHVALAQGMQSFLECPGVGPELAQNAVSVVERRFDAVTMNRRVLGMYRDLWTRRKPCLQQIGGSLKSCVRSLSGRLPFWRMLSSSLIRPQTLRILMYHRVRDGFPHDPLSVSTVQFAQQMTALHMRHVPMLPLNLALARLADGTLPEGAVAITFDDAYADICENALPILQDMQTTATVYAPTTLIDTGGMIERYANDPNAGRLMTWDELRHLHACGWDIGSHTCTHRQLPDLTDEDMHAELINARTRIADMIGTPPTSLAYPRGHLNRKVVEAVKDAGYDHALTVWPGEHTAKNHPLLICRTEVSGADTLADFLWKLRGGFDTVQRLRARNTPVDPRNIPNNPPM